MIVAFRALVVVAAAALVAACTTAPPSAPTATPVATSAIDRIRASGVLRVCMTGDYQPFGYLRPDGVYEGIDVDLAGSLARSMKAEARFVPTAWGRLVDDFASGVCDIGMGGVSVTLDRQLRAGFSEATMEDGKVPIVRCADLARYPTLAAIDRPGTRAIVNPGGTNERYAREHLKEATLRVHPDNVTIFDELVAGRADVMITDRSETILQHRLRPTLCSVPLERPLQYGVKAYLLPRDDPAFKAYVDQWLHLAKATGEWDAVVARWLQ